MATIETSSAPVKAARLGARVQDFPAGGARAISLRAVAGHPRALVGAIMTALVVGMAVVASFWTPYDPIAFDSGPSFDSPSWQHLMGTDLYGRDIFSRVMAGSQVSLLIAASAVTGAVVIGTVVGIAAGYLGGFIDIILTRMVDIMLAIPGLVLALGIVVLLTHSAQSVAVALMAVYSWQIARVVRSSVVAVRDRPYVEASKALDAKPMSIVRKDVFPSVFPILILQLTTAFAWGILDEASLGFLGLGVQPPNPSWGSMLIEGREFLYQAPWLPVSAGAMVMVAVLGVNLLGDGLRDIVDPRAGRKTS